MVEYKNYIISLNVNTITDSETMFLRRLIEILSCGGVCVTNFFLSVEKMYKDYCYEVNNKEDFKKLILKIQNKGLDKKDYERMRAGAGYVLKEHT